MQITSENILLTGSLLLLTSILAGKTSRHFGVPTLILFLVIGMLAGSEGIGGILFADPQLTQFIGIIALNFILFSGGLDTSWQSIRPVLWRGIALSTICVCLTAIAVGLFVHFVWGFTLAEGLLLGSIVSATDAAAVFSILRSKGIGLKGNLGPVLELESGSNDPMAYFLTISLTTVVVNQHMNPLELVPLFFKEFLLGALIGFLMGKGSAWLINRIKLDTDGLYPVLVLGLVIFTYSFTHSIGGNGFLATYLSAIILGNSDFIHRKSIIRFYEGQAWLMQIILFLTLGLFVFPSHILPIIGMGLLISAFLIFVARPLGVFSSLAFFNINARSKLFVSWVGLRGAVPIVFATYPMIAGIEKAGLIFNLAFFISITSVLLQGTTLGWVAKKLHLSVPAATKKKTEQELSESKKSRLEQIGLTENSNIVNKKLVAIGLPATVYIIAIKRDNAYVTPSGNTLLLAGDILYVLAENEAAMKEAYRKIGKGNQ
ncbi:MAG: potassium/proton antiporter [Bacteroidota bacterium]